MNRQQEVLNSPFDIETHKQTFIHYLEVVILSDGTVEYAVPSHQEKLIRVCCDKHISRAMLVAMCPPEYYCDFNTWLYKMSGCISVWEWFYQGRPNESQIATLQKLKDVGLYLGKIF